MKQINPIYIIVLLIMTLAVVLFNLVHVKNKLHEAQNHFDQTKSMVHDIVDIQQNWDNKKQTKNSIRRILRSSILRKTNIVQQEKRGTIILHAGSLNSTTASYLLSRIMNEPFVIKSMKIRRLNKEYASIDMEIAL